MTKTARLEVRIDPDLMDRLRAFAADRPGTVAEHVRYAVRCYLDREERTMDTYNGNDRVQQVNVLRDWVANMVFGMDDPNAASEDQIAYFVDTYEETVGEPLPSWFDDHDRRLMVEWLDDSK